MTLDGAVREVLAADAAAAVRAKLTDLATWTMRESCLHGQDPQRRQQSDALLRMALELRTLIVAGSGESTAAAGSAARPAEAPGARSTGTSSTGDSPTGNIPSWLADARDNVRRVTQGRLWPGTVGPAELWCQLNLGCCWLGETARAQCRTMLRTAAPGDLTDDGLVPPVPELEVDGISWQLAERHPALTKLTSGWTEDRRARFGPLLRLTSLTLTLVDHCAGLHSAITHSRVTAVSTADDRADYRQYLLRQLGGLGDPGLPWREEIECLVEVDQRIRSVFPLPFPAPLSWWVIQLQNSIEMIAARARQGSPAAIVELVRAGARLDSSEYHGYLGKDNISIAPLPPGDLGTVLWPLRAYLSLPADDAGHTPIVRLAQVAYGHQDWLQTAASPPGG